MRARRVACAAEAHADFERRHEGHTEVTRSDMEALRLTPRSMEARGHFERSLLEVRRTRLFFDVSGGTAATAITTRRRAAQWDVRRSIWAPRAKWADSKDVYETERVVRRHFRALWPDALGAGIRATIERELGVPARATAAQKAAVAERAEAEAEAVAGVFEGAHELWYHLFTYYASLNSELDFLTLNTWTQLLEVRTSRSEPIGSSTR